jgi:hypothetical protein
MSFTTFFMTLNQNIALQKLKSVTKLLYDNDIIL